MADPRDPGHRAGLPTDVASRPYGRPGSGGSFVAGGRGATLPGPGAFPNVAPSVPMPEVYPPPGSVDFNRFEDATVPSPGTAIVAEFELPPQMVGVIRAVTLYVDAFDTTFRGSWSLLLNDGAVPGWELTTFPRSASSYSESYGPEETLIRVRRGGKIGWRLEVTAGAGYRMGVLYHGWYYDVGIDAALSSAWRV